MASSICFRSTFAILIILVPIDPAAHLSFLTSLLSRIDREKSAEAYVLILSTLAHAKLLYGDMQGTRIDIEEATKVYILCRDYGVY